MFGFDCADSDEPKHAITSVKQIDNRMSIFLRSSPEVSFAFQISTVAVGRELSGSLTPDGLRRPAKE